MKFWSRERKFCSSLREIGVIRVRIIEGLLLYYWVYFVLFAKSDTHSNRRRWWWRKRLLKSELTLFQNLLPLSHVVLFDKCWGVEFWRTVSECKKDFKQSLSLFMPCRKREIWQFHVLVVQRRQRNEQKKREHVQRRWFANPDLLLFCRTRCRCCRGRQSLSFLVTGPRSCNPR